MQFPDKLTVIRKLDEGGFGKVFLCENNFLNKRKEAVKVIETSTDNLDELKNNLFESSVLEYLRGCQYIVNVHSAEIINNNFLISMEYMHNGSVQGLLDKINFIETKQLIKIAESVLQAMEYAHNKNILHLDIKPGNILIENNNIYKLSDFGLAGIINNEGTCDFKKIYTAHFPPEKLNRKTGATSQTDIYMFGVTLYRLANGDSHFVRQFEKHSEDTRNAIINGKIPNRNDYLPHVPKKLKQIINKCINTDLNKRYKTVREIKKDFGTLKVNCDWKIVSNDEKMLSWSCLCNGRLAYELHYEKKQNNQWDVVFYKITNKKLRVTKHCYKNLIDKVLNNKLNIIFNEYTYIKQ